jgi:hypothetical protein
MTTNVLTEEQKANSLKWDADALMEQIIMQESRHMQMTHLVEYQLEYPDMTIRDFFDMAARDLEAQDEDEEDFDPDIDYGECREVGEA